MKPIRKFLALALAIAGIIALPSLSFALPPLVEVTLNGGSWNVSPFVVVGAPSGYISRGAATTLASGGRSASGQVSASAGFGVMRTYAQVHANNTSGGGVNFLAGQARFRDNRITNAPGREGQAGMVTVKYTVTGNRTLAAPFNTAVQPGISESDAQFFISLNSNNLVERHDRIRANGDTSCGSGDCTPYLNIEQTFTYPVTFGVAYDFEMILSSRATLWSYTGFIGDATVDLGHTMTWGGIVSVTDAGGNPIANYTDTSSSGSNYVAPIVPQCAPPAESLTGWWPGDNNARDIDGGNNGALESGTTYGAGRVGQAFSFAAAGARVHVPHAAALDFNATQDYTIDFWMNAGPQTGGGGTLVEKNGVTYPYSVRLLPTGNISAAVSDATNTISVIGTGAPRVDDNLWHHIAVVFKHSTKVLQLYVDGALDASQSYTETLGALANGQDLYFGARSDGSNSFVGSIDEVDISSGALNQTEIQAIAAAADLGKCRAPVAATAAVSRKTHGAAGDFDINLPFSGTLGVEGRGTGSSHKIVFTFPAAVTFSGVNIPSGTAAGAKASSPTPTEVVVDLAGVTNGQWLTVNLVNVDNGISTNDVAVRLGFLTGDTNGSGAVSASDVGQTKAQSGQPVTSANFRQDVNVSGGNISASDIGLVKSKSGDSLPPP